MLPGGDEIYKPMRLQGFIASCNPNNLREVNRRRNFEVSSARPEYLL
jgi:hypothetical protein